MADSHEARTLLDDWFRGEKRFFEPIPDGPERGYLRLSADWPEWPAYQAVCRSLAQWVDTLPDARLDSKPLWILAEDKGPFCAKTEDALQTWRDARLLCKRLQTRLGQQAAPQPVRLEDVQAVVSVQRAKLVEFLWARGAVRFEVLRNVPGAFRDSVVSGEAVQTSLKRLSGELAEHPELGVTVSYSLDKGIARLERPAD